MSYTQTMTEPTETVAIPQHTSGSNPYSKVPLEFVLNSQGRNLSIDSPDGKALLAVTIPRRSMLLHQNINIHTTADANSQVLSSAVNRFSAGKTVPITVGSTKLDMEGHWSPPPHFEIVIPVGSGKQERFEWRVLKDKDAQRLGIKKGYGLLRIGGIGRKVSEQDEIVATWITDFDQSRLGGHFKFVDAGASGELGETFAIAAITTAVAIGKIMREMIGGKAFTKAGYGA